MRREPVVGEVGEDKLTKRPIAHDLRAALHISLRTYDQDHHLGGIDAMNSMAELIDFVAQKTKVTMGKPSFI